MTMKTYKLLLLGLGALWFTSCENIFILLLYGIAVF